VHVISTAGHVDHGKSTLVKALTGSEPDRLAEERRRGLSIELGYCWTTLPGVGDVAFVDVPGHERFISTMLAGVGPVPAVLFVVAADDPWMPQAAEHLAVLDALGVSHGVLAVTRSDLADPGAAAARARTELSGTSLNGITVIAVSGRTGEGMDDLRAALVALVEGLPEPDPAADVRLWVDRRFHVTGTGTVVTGTLSAGRVAVGDQLVCDGQPVRVRAIQTLQVDVPAVSATARVALSVSGDGCDSLSRGSALVTPGAWLSTTTVDVATAAPDDLPAQAVVHIGATSVGCRCRPLGAGFTRLGLDRPLPLRVADRLVVRDPGSRKVWGASVVDPAPPRLRRRGAARDRAQILAGAAGQPPVAAELSRRRTATRSLLRQLGHDLTGVDEHAVTAGDWLLDRAAVPDLQQQLRLVVAEHDARHPLDPGLATGAAAVRLGLPTAELLSALVAPPLHVQGGRVRSETSALPGTLLRSLDQLAEHLSDDPYAAPTAEDLARLGLDTKAIAAGVKAGRLLRLADGVVVLPGADIAAATTLGALPQPFTVSQARTALGSSRRVVLPLLARLDRLGLTRRLPDDRREVTSSG
jgi:selenocysteine-specific elongation factor